MLLVSVIIVSQLPPILEVQRSAYDSFQGRLLVQRSTYDSFQGRLLVQRSAYDSFQRGLLASTETPVCYDIYQYLLVSVGIIQPPLSAQRNQNV